MVLFPDKRSESHVRNESFSIMAFLAYSKYIDSDCFHCRYCYCLYYGASDLFWKECIRSLFFVAISSSANGCRIWFTLSVGQKWAYWTRFGDRKSTRLNSSHVSISYAVFCLKKNTL